MEGNIWHTQAVVLESNFQGNVSGEIRLGNIKLTESLEDAVVGRWVESWEALDVD